MCVSLSGEGLPSKSSAVATGGAGLICGWNGHSLVKTALASTGLSESASVIALSSLICDEPVEDNAVANMISVWEVR